MSDLDAMIAQMWATFAPLARSRVEVLEQYAAALADGQDGQALRDEATTAAHKLAGALGTYSRPGSQEAFRLEALLKDGRPTADEVLPLVHALREAVDG